MNITQWPSGAGKLRDGIQRRTKTTKTKCAGYAVLHMMHVVQIVTTLETIVP